MVRSPRPGRLVSPQGEGEGRRAGLVAERPPWALDSDLPAGPALVEPARHEAQRHPLVLVAPRFRSPAVLLRGRFRLFRRLRRARAPLRPDRRGVSPDRRLRAPLVHALSAHEPRGSLESLPRPRRPDHDPHALGVLRPDGRARQPRAAGSRGGPAGRRRGAGTGTGPDDGGRGALDPRGMIPGFETTDFAGRSSSQTGRRLLAWGNRSP